MTSEITVGIDIGTSSVKAIAADADGTVVAFSRVPHEIQIPAPDRFQHDAASAWRCLAGRLRADEIACIRAPYGFPHCGKSDLSGANFRVDFTIDMTKRAR